jgi:hypothetical protein
MFRFFLKWFLFKKYSNKSEKIKIFLETIYFLKINSKKKRNNKKRNKKGKTSYLMLGHGPVGNSGRPRCVATASAPTSLVDSTSPQQGHLHRSEEAAPPRMMWTCYDAILRTLQKMRRILGHILSRRRGGYSDFARQSCGLRKELHWLEPPKLG